MGLSRHGDPVFPHFGVSFLEPSFCGSNPIESVVCTLCAGCRRGPYGCQIVGVAVSPRAVCVVGCVLAQKSLLMSATCVLWYVLGDDTGLSKHRVPVFPDFYPLNQNLARVRGGGDFRLGL
jgi:hypothetical protein